MKNLIIILLMLITACNAKPLNSGLIKQQDSLKAELKTSDIYYKTSLRRLGTIVITDSLDMVYWSNSALYYKTGKEKYRIIANKSIEKYNASYDLYKRQTDSVNLYLHKTK